MVAGDDGSSRDLAVRCDAAAHIRDVASAVAMASHPGISDHAGWQVFSFRRQAWLHGDLKVLDAGLLHGDVVALREAPPAGRSVVPSGAGEAPLDAVPGMVVPFNRPPRVSTAPPVSEHCLDAPPAAAARGRIPLSSALLPLALGGAMLFFYRSPVTLLFLAMSPLLAVGSYVEGRVSGRAEQRRRVEGFRQQLVGLRIEMAEAREAETWRRRSEAPGLQRVAIAAHRRDSSLWARRPTDEDFLSVRVAVTDAESAHQVRVTPGGDPALAEEARMALKPFAMVEQVPLLVSLASVGSTGIAGRQSAVVATARWIVLQAAALHSPRNLAICAAIPAPAAREWDWLKWLPHTNPTEVPVGGCALAVDPASAHDLLDRLIGLIDSRVAEVEPLVGTRRRSAYSHVLVLLDEGMPMRRADITRLMTDGPRAGIMTVWLGGAVSDLPNECRAVVELDAGQGVVVTYPANGLVERGDRSRDVASLAEARQVALELAPLRDTASRDSQAELPRQVAISELLDLAGDTPGDKIVARWAAPPGRLVATVGVSSDGPFGVDLRADGPHVLVAGTTGAGKSELLQAIVISLAAAHPPSRINFLLVDYKGGSAFGQAARLPHSVGLVTDLDGHLAHRALVSLRAELRRRERILRDASARDIAELEHRNVARCPANLVIVVDEFATLSKEVPEFVDGIVDLAQRGRSLGLHLVLATQRPAGVVSDSIRANTNIRIALRVSDEDESRDVIAAPGAAHIARTNPGRALARTGHRELTEFQTAYSGAVRQVTAPGVQVEVAEFQLTGPAWNRLDSDASGGPGATDLVRLVDAIVEAHEQGTGVAASRPWLPELPPLLTSAALNESLEAGGPGVALGRVDKPDAQLQEPWVWNVEKEGRLLVLGSSGSGKTSLLRTMAHGLCMRYGPEDLHLYAIDCAGGDLAALQALPQCGGVLLADERDRIARLIQHLREVLDRRRTARAALIDAKPVASLTNLPLVVLFLDNYSGFAATMEKVDFGDHVDAFAQLLGEGPSLGMRFVVTADRRGAVPNSVAALTDLKVVLRMADDEEFKHAGLAVSTFRGADLPPGRGFLGQGLEVQCAVLGAAGDAAEQGEVLARAGVQLRQRFPGSVAPPIRLLPVRVDADMLPPPGAPYRAVVGLLDGDMEPAELDLGEDHQLIAGPPHSGRSTALLVAVSSLRASTPTARFVLLSPRNSPLLTCPAFDEIAHGVEGCEAHVDRLLNARLPESSSWVVVVDDADELADSPCGAQLELLVRRARGTANRFIAAVETRAAHRSYGGWVAELRKARQGLLLQPDPDLDGDILGAHLPRGRARALPAGRGYRVYRGKVDLVQVATPAAT